MPSSRGKEIQVTGNHKMVSRVIKRTLSGEGAHAPTREVFSGLDWKSGGAKPRGAPHSLFQLLNHMVFWQEWVLQWLQGNEPPTPRHARGGWPGAEAPGNAGEWKQAVRRFQQGLSELDRRFRQEDPLSGSGAKSRLEMAQTIGAHNSYHAGQAAMLRQILGKWPPPSGGLTW